MTTIRASFGDDRVGQKFERATSRNRERVLSSLRGTAQEVSTTFLARARADIAGAGRFGPRWITGLHADVTEGGGSIRINAHHDVPYFMVHQRGALIRGKPLLAIPLSFAKDAQGVMARDFPGGLFRVDRRSGAPLLLSFRDKKPKYFLRESVRVPKRFHVVEILRDVVNSIREIYDRQLKKNG